MAREIHTLDELIAHLDAGKALREVVCQGIDLRGEEERLSAHDAEGTAFLGCPMSDRLKGTLLDAGALIFPRLPDLPYRPYRPHLYDFDELIAGFDPARPQTFFTDTADAAIYHHADRFRASPDVPKPKLPVLEALAQRLHDHAIDDALGDLLCDRKVVAIMGGHGMGRHEPAYRAVAHIARGLTRGGRFIATGGGPGAMEAGNLGAAMAPLPGHALDEAIAHLAPAPHYRDDAYVLRALDVRARYFADDGTRAAESLAIPTWFYGHEPTNPFATHIAKYFANSIREDGLLAIAHHGVVYAPGSAGTIQEVFMDACQNHYGTFGAISPMVFFDRQFWTEVRPVYPLLEQLAREQRYGSLLTLEDDPDAVISFLLDHPPIKLDP